MRYFTFPLLLLALAVLPGCRKTDTVPDPVPTPTPPVVVVHPPPLPSKAVIYSGQEAGCPLRLPLFDRSAIDWRLNPAMAAAYRRLLRFYRAQPAVPAGTLTRYPPTPTY